MFVFKPIVLKMDVMEHVPVKKENKIQTSVFENFNKLVKGNQTQQKKSALLLLRADAENVSHFCMVIITCYCIFCFFFLFF